MGDHSGEWVQRSSNSSKWGYEGEQVKNSLVNSWQEVKENLYPNLI